MSYKKNFFTYRKLVNSNPLKYIIVPIDYDTFPMNLKKGGSYALAPARILGLDYVTYLKFLRDLFPNEVSLKGKGSLYVIPCWRKGKELFTFIDLLNNKMNLALKGKS